MLGVDSGDEHDRLAELAALFERCVGGFDLVEGVSAADFEGEGAVRQGREDLVRAPLDRCSVGEVVRKARSGEEEGAGLAQLIGIEIVQGAGNRSVIDDESTDTGRAKAVTQGGAPHGIEYYVELGFNPYIV